MVLFFLKSGSIIEYEIRIDICLFFLSRKHLIGGKLINLLHPRTRLYLETFGSIISSLTLHYIDLDYKRLSWLYNYCEVF